MTIASCTKGVLQKISNLKKLGIRIELMPDDTSELPFRCLHHISCLDKLESLKCVVVNPELMMPEAGAPTAALSIFPSSLVKLHLSGLCYPWEYMDIICSLPDLQVLKLQCYAFQGPKWEVEQFKFRRLRYLLIDDADLVEWNVQSGSFSRLRHLRIQHCYNLEEFNWDSTHCFKLVVVDSNPLVETFFSQEKALKGVRERHFCHVSFHSSWDD